METQHHSNQIERDHFIQFLVVDLFCGAGGTTIGFEKSESSYEEMYAFLRSVGIDPPPNKEVFYKLSKVIACVNHDPIAIKSHWKNHPDVNHFEEDIRILDPYGSLKRCVDVYRACYPEAKLILWASLECTNYSKAKGGESRDADSRTLAFELYHYINALDPDYIFIENVVEFMAWGPLLIKMHKSKEGYESCMIKIKNTGKGKDKKVHVKPFLVPESSKNGKDWVRWCNHIKTFGYNDQWKKINCADLGAYTSRERLFGCFAKEGLPIVWPVMTHAKNPQKNSMNAELYKWKAVKEVLDFDDEGTSIFNRTLKDGRPDPLSTNTMQRLFMGSVKHIAGGEAHYLTKFFSGKPEHKNASVNEPSPSVTTFGGGGLVKHCFIDQRNGMGESRAASIEDPAKTLTQTGGNQQLITHFISKGYGGRDPEHMSSSIESPISTITTTKDHNQIVNASFITKWNSNKKKEDGGGHSGHSIDEPAPVVPTQNRLGIAQASFLQNYYTSGGTHSSIEEPAHTVRTRDGIAKIQADYFLDKRYTADHNHQSIDEPAGAVVGNDKHALIKAEKFILNGNFKNSGSSIENPSPAVLASRRHHYIVNPSWFGNSGSVEEPCYVVIARQDKAPLYLITAKVCGSVAVPVYDGDCEWTIKLKEFMALYNICDIKMRMLKVSELKLIQGFPSDYILEGTQTDQKKFIGNAVHNYVPKNWIEAFGRKFHMIQYMAA